MLGFKLDNFDINRKNSSINWSCECFDVGNVRCNEEVSCLSLGLSVFQSIKWYTIIEGFSHLKVFSKFCMNVRWYIVKKEGEKMLLHALAFLKKQFQWFLSLSQNQHYRTKFTLQYFDIFKVMKKKKQLNVWINALKNQGNLPHTWR